MTTEPFTVDLQSISAHAYAMKDYDYYYDYDYECKYFVMELWKKPWLRVITHVICLRYGNFLLFPTVYSSDAFIFILIAILWYLFE